MTNVLILLIKLLLWVIDRDHREAHRIDNEGNRKFTHSLSQNSRSDFGDIISAHRTVPYDAWLLRTENHRLVAADKHIVIVDGFQEVFMEDLQPGQIIMTDTGPEKVMMCLPLNCKVHMYDLQIQTDADKPEYDHLYYTDGILSHNTTLAAAYCLWWALFKPNQTVLVASNIGANAKEIMLKVKDMYMECPLWLKAGVKTDNIFELVFDNGSRIVAKTTTPNTGRGMTPALVYLDEFAFVSPNVQAGFWTSIQPSLSEGGRLIMTSTPNTDEDTFSRLWFNADDAPNSQRWSRRSIEEGGRERDNEEYETIFEDEDMRKDHNFGPKDEKKEEDQFGFKRFFVHWTAHPNRDERFKRKQLADGMPISEWNRDFECMFAGAEDSLISSPTLIRITNHTNAPRFVDQYGVQWFEYIEPNATYGVTIDPSEGIGKDNAVIQVWQFPQMIQVAEWARNDCDQFEQAKMLTRVLKRIAYEQETDVDHRGEANIYYTVECNGVGMGVLNLIVQEEHNIPGQLVDSEGNASRGLRTTSLTKRQYALQFKDITERAIFYPSSLSLLNEMKSFVKTGSSYAAKRGLKDDRVMSCILMLNLLEELKYTVDGIEKILTPSVLDDDTLSPLPDMIF